MEKDFDRWNEMKKTIDQKEDRLFFHEGEVWWINLGLNIGFEMNGGIETYMRPVIILNKYNMYSFLALPLSTSKKLNSYRIPVGTIEEKEATANLSQLRNIDSKRLVNKICSIEPHLLHEIKKIASRVNFG